MIQIIRQLCQRAGCDAKDLAVEWTPTRGVRLIATNAEGKKTYLNVLARPDHIAQAIYLCANGQEHLYPRIQQQQEAIDSQLREWLSKDSESPGIEWCKQEAAVPAVMDWRECNTAAEMVLAFPKRPSADDIIDLYQRNKVLRSADIEALLRRLSR